jgi:hypothetical protein
LNIGRLGTVPYCICRIDDEELLGSRILKQPGFQKIAPILWNTLFESTVPTISNENPWYTSLYVASTAITCASIAMANNFFVGLTQKKLN